MLLLQSGAAIKHYLILLKGIEYCGEFRALQNKMLLQSVAAIDIYLTVALNIELLLQSVAAIEYYFTVLEKIWIEINCLLLNLAFAAVSY